MEMIDILKAAVQKGASDIHLEPQLTEDGEQREHAEQTDHEHQALADPSLIDLAETRNQVA